MNGYFALTALVKPASLTCSSERGVNFRSPRLRKHKINISIDVCKLIKSQDFCTIMYYVFPLYNTVIMLFCFHLPLRVFFNDSEHYFDTTIGFLGPENIGLAYLFKFLS